MVFGHVFSVAFALIARTIPAPVFVIALRRVADVAAFSPIPQFSRLFWGILFLLTEF